MTERWVFKTFARTDPGSYPERVAALESDLAQARKEAEGYRKALEAASKALEHALYLIEEQCDCRNGVTDPSGSIDEGRVLADKCATQIRDALKAIGEKGEGA